MSWGLLSGDRLGGSWPFSQNIRGYSYPGKTLLILGLGAMGLVVLCGDRAGWQLSHRPEEAAILFLKDRAILF
ncbi:hypothetical protein [Laspinema olomoucense]|uniref:hypothetical protein n=1 Tax=Laspinema olomoucense TaxID=3231600 RepID=UPI0021BBB426|nr:MULTISPECIES: hypothetical protein [unclassified Laspinema]MCT7975844.1 hypothetical protein [Laspinema sp. D3d]MCT7996582.1 hypothetical protein [Laspinema sp. D3c]